MSAAAVKPPPRWLVPLLALACGLVVANLYYGQPLAGAISQAIHLPPAAAGLVVTMTQAGYGLGLLAVVPLGDMLDPRAVVRAALVLLSAGLLAAGLSGTAPQFLAAAVVVGLGASVVQVMVPYASHLAPERQRGKVLGQVVGGLMVGIMLARPAASLIAQVSSWRAPLLVSAALMAPLGLALGALLPSRRPEQKETWTGLMASMGRLMLDTPLLRRRALYQACMFGAFSVFWTATPLLLTGPDYRMSQGGVALFALVGAAGAISAPLSGRWADRGWTRVGTAVAMTAACAAFLLSRLAPPHSLAGVGLLAAAGLLLDFSVTCTLVFGQRAIYGLSEGARSRMNGLYIATFFCGGAAASALAGWTFATGGWARTAWLGAALPALALAYFATEPKAD
jgi:predicted MFS family arabinose efflux permease